MSRGTVWVLTSAVLIAVVTVKTPDPEKPDAAAASTTFEAPKITWILPKNPTEVQTKKMTRALTTVIGDVGDDTTAKRAAIATLQVAQEPVDEAQLVERRRPGRTPLGSAAEQRVQTVRAPPETNRFGAVAKRKGPIHLESGRRLALPPHSKESDV